MSETPIIDLELASPAFCGPLALLLELIEKRRLPITEVSLAQVADQYLERLRTLVGLNAELLADFLVIGARLLVIKSRALLPSQQQTTDESDIAVDLEQRLLEYRVFKEAAVRLRELEESGRHSYPRQVGEVEEERPEPPLEPIPPEVLAAAMARMLKALQPQAARMELAPRVSIEQRIEHLVSYLSSRLNATFAELSGNTVGEIVATFLAILELMRRGLLDFDQQSPFGEILVSLVPGGGDRYALAAAATAAAS
jgi:segregation and condensation protein A